LNAMVGGLEVYEADLPFTVANVAMNAWALGGRALAVSSLDDFDVPFELHNQKYSVCSNVYYVLAAFCDCWKRNVASSKTVWNDSLVVPSHVFPSDSSPRNVASHF